jgi:peptidyl-prolyl cis-trans isomerase SurA
MPPMLDLPPPKRLAPVAPPALDDSALKDGPARKQEKPASPEAPVSPDLTPAPAPRTAPAPPAAASAAAPAAPKASAGPGAATSRDQLSPRPASNAGPTAVGTDLEPSPAPALEPASAAGAKPATAPAAGTGNGPEAVNPPRASDNSTAAGKPASPDKLAAELSLEPSPVSNLAPPAPAVTVRRVAARPAPAPAPRDDQIVRTAAKQPDNVASTSKNKGKKAAGPVARVGDEVITFLDLVVATREMIQRYPELRARANFNSTEQLEKRKQIDLLARRTLNDLIERSMLVQEAKRQLKDPKQIERVMDAADRLWTEEELPPLMRAYHVATRQQLKEKLAEQGRSLESLRQSYRQGFLAESFVYEKLKDKVNVDLPDLLKYYDEHVRKHEFDRPAQITWREIVVDPARYSSRADARRKAEALLSKLSRGEDFASLARAESDGGTTARKEGGLMHTSPGAYAVATVNRAIEYLPIGRTSGVLEGADSFHIVRVENRRPAGPASFEEVQEKILPILVRRKRESERAAFIAKLRQKTLVTTIFDGTRYDLNSLANAK